MIKYDKSFLTIFVVSNQDIDLKLQIWTFLNTTWK